MERHRLYGGRPSYRLAVLQPGSGTLIRGGVPLKPQKEGAYRRRSLRALNGLDGNTRLNRELWDLADSYTLNN